MLNQLIRYNIVVANNLHIHFAQAIVDEINYSAKIRGTGIEDRDAQYIIDKINTGLAVLAIDQDSGDWLGFCCIDAWEHKKYIASTGLIIKPQYRGVGIAKAIKYHIFELCRTIFPDSKIFSLTANPVVKKVNKELGFKPVSFLSVMNDTHFIDGNVCQVDFIEMMKEKYDDPNYSALVYNPDDVECTQQAEAYRQIAQANL